jgi:hypothetical protein
MSALRQNASAHESAARLEHRSAPDDAKARLHAVEDARDPRVLDANTHEPRYLCVGFAVIRV